MKWKWNSEDEGMRNTAIAHYSEQTNNRMNEGFIHTLQSDNTCDSYKYTEHNTYSTIEAIMSLH